MSVLASLHQVNSYSCQCIVPGAFYRSVTRAADPGSHIQMLWSQVQEISPVLYSVEQLSCRTPRLPDLTYFKSSSTRSLTWLKLSAFKAWNAWCLACM